MAERLTHWFNRFSYALEYFFLREDDTLVCLLLKKDSYEIILHQRCVFLSCTYYY